MTETLAPELAELRVDMPEPGNGLPELNTERATRWDSPAAVARALDEIFDELATWQAEHVKYAIWLEQLEGQLVSLKARLYPQTTGTVDERKHMLQRMVEQTQLWAQSQLAGAQIAGCKRAYDYLDARRSIAQSLLNRFKWEAEHDRFGRGQRNDGGRA